MKILAKLAMDIPKLNQKVLFVQSLLPDYVLMLEASYERLCLLCQLQDSAFLRPNIYPALKLVLLLNAFNTFRYYLREGDEEQCKSEMLQLFQFLKVKFQS